MLLIVQSVSPDLESTLHIKCCILGLRLPETFQCTDFRILAETRPLISIPPSIEHLTHEFLASECITQFPLLNTDLNRLECFLMPLLDGDLFP